MIWFDLDNSPHVPLFRPIFTELEKRGVQYIVTARDYAQTAELLSFWGVNHTVIGAHAGKNKIKKVLNLLNRGRKLKKFIKGKNVKLAVSHGSRSQLVAAKMLGVKSLLMLDYEYTEAKIFNRLSTHLLMPAVIPDKRLLSAGFDLKKVLRYSGFKEEIYLREFVPDKNFRSQIEVREDEILVVIRPPGMSGNYHDPRSEHLLLEAINHFSSSENTVCIIVNRTAREKNFILSNIKMKPNMKFLDKPVDGLQLLFAADITLSGGGTMNRESALLGTKTYSIFTGRYPYLDEYLRDKGKLNFIVKKEEIKRIAVYRDYDKHPPVSENNLVTEITDTLTELAN
jgi:predicted glycosyltransferase